MNTLELLKINVNDHTEKKNGLTYLSWAWAWQEAIKADPAATWQIKMFGAQSDQPYCWIGDTAMVFVEVTMFSKTLCCQLPVLDHRNKAIPNPDAFQVNTAIMRCLAKGNLRSIRHAVAQSQHSRQYELAGVPRLDY